MFHPFRYNHPQDTNMQRRQLILASLLATSALTPMVWAQTAPWPDKPVQVSKTLSERKEVKPEE